MKTWIIFDRNGLAKCEAHKLEYSGEFLGACSVNVEIASPTPIGFEIGDYLEYRGERFEMNYDPSVVKQASAGAHGESFLYSGVVFNALSDELTRCEFLDYVPSDNELHYSSLPTFSFFAENVKVLAERIQVNLDRIYTGAKKWSVNIHGERTEAKNVNVTISNQSCWDALGLVKTLFGENFIVRGRTITIGTSGIVMGSTLTYGKGNGLCKIERNAESNQKIITRLRAYGSTRNMSPSYYRSLGMQVFGEVIWIVDREATDHLKCYLNIPYEEGLFADNGNVTVKINGVEASATITKHEVKDEFEGCCVLYAASPELFAVTQDGMKAYFTSGVNKHRFPHSNKEYLENVPNNMAVMHLMLPSFPNETLDPYLDSKHIDVLGVREGTVFFDGSNGLEEIYPTMEGMTAEDLKVSGVDVEAEGNLDEVVSAELIEDDGVPANVNDIPPFQITLKDIGFDINQYWGTSQPTISMKDGMCGGREFEIQSCKKEGANYVLTCNRSEDSSLGLFFPYKDYPIRTGDKFVLLNLEMPDVYVQAASQRLLKAAQDYLKKHDYVRYNYIPSVDNIYMARQHDEAIANGGVSIHDTIKEGDFLLFEDEDLGIMGSVTISSLRIKEDTSSSLIPEYDIVLQEEKTLGTIERIQNQINNIEAGGVVGSVNTEQVQGIVEAVGKRKFLSKERDDRTKHSLGVGKDLTVGGNLASDNFVQGDTMGVGWSVYRDANGNFVVETDRMIVRKDMFVNELVVNQDTYNKGSIFYVKAGCTITRVVEYDNFYRCYYDNQGKARYSGFVVGDQARCQRYDQSYKDLVKYYWRLVVGVGDDFVDLSKVMTEYEGSGVPEEGDDIAQLGNRTDKTRQSAIVISPDNGGSVVVWAGIDSFELSDKNMVGMGVNIDTGRAYLYGYGDMYFGDRRASSYMKYNPEDGLELRGSLSVGSKLPDGREVDDFVGNVDRMDEDLSTVKEMTDKDYTIWFFEYEPTLENKPAVDWTTEEEKALHEQDMFYYREQGKAWRFESGNWVEITDQDTLRALELITQTRNELSNFDYLKDAMKDYTTKIEGGLLMTSLVAVQNDKEEVEAFLNGSDFAKDNTHGKLLLAGGIPEGSENIEDRAKNATTRIFEDGHVVLGSADVKGLITAKSMNLSVTDGGGEENPTDLTTSSGFRLEGHYRLPLLANNTFTELVGLWISPVTRVPRLCTILCNDALIEVLYYNGTIYNGVSQINISHEGGFIKASMMGHQYSEWGGQCWNLNIEKSSDVYVEIISHA